MSALANFGSEDHSEKSESEQEDRDTSSKHFELRASLTRIRGSAEGERPTRGVAGTSCSHQQMTFSVQLSNSQGAGIRLRC